jgi:hypothetical protein
MHANGLGTPMLRWIGGPSCEEVISVSPFIGAIAYELRRYSSEGHYESVFSDNHILAEAVKRDM